jgi:uncharacterized protein YyaL (SSP411 family)
MNHLHQESSPYLRQHADNPVNWYPWKEEALQKAIKEDKPILLSIGYSTCHWCHVMERESFMDEEVAAYMNQHFINIKVDREERPDLDQFYMDACQVITGQAGWPLNLFLTPDRKPFYGGTYFPPETAGRALSWFQALQYAAYNFYEHRSAVDQQANKVLRRMKGQEVHADSGLSALPQEEVLKEWEALPQQFLQTIQQKQDQEHGGFGHGQKYPNTMALEFLLTYARQFHQPQIANHIRFTLNQMLRGGMYDLVGGGWCRYATDRAWKVPHFEKMLYDNALMVSLTAAFYQYEPQDAYQKAIEQTLDFVKTELSNGEGGFYSALDADTDGVEGAYYTWTRAEIEEVLDEDADYFSSLMDIRSEGNWEEGQNILQLVSMEEATESTAFLEQCFQKLRLARSSRKPPHRDEKLLLSWNAIQAVAYMDAYHALGTTEYKLEALKALSFMKAHFQQDEGLVHTLKGEQQVKAEGFLSDYAFYIQALIKAYALDWDTAFLTQARHWTHIAIEKFYDERSGLFFFSEKNSEELPFLYKDKGDAELPSAGAQMIDNLRRLALFFEEKNWERMAFNALRNIQKAVASNAFQMASWASLLVNEVKGWKELAVTGPEAFLAAEQVQKDYLPGLIIMAGETPAEDWPLLKYRFSEDQTRFFLCENYTCKAPYFSVAELKQALS